MKNLFYHVETEQLVIAEDTVFSFDGNEDYQLVITGDDEAINSELEDFCKHRPNKNLFLRQESLDVTVIFMSN